MPEAMATGACVVVRNTFAVAEIVGEAGAVTETGDPEALAATISTLLDAPERRTQLGSAARKRAGRFTVEQMGPMTFASYCAALERRELQVTGEDTAGHKPPNRCTR